MCPAVAPDFHVSTVHYGIPFDLLWSHLSDPLQFPHLYPNWTTQVDRADEASFRGVGPGGDTFRIIQRLNRDHGVIDFEIIAEGGETEVSRSRLFPLPGRSCLYVHVATRSSRMDDAFWNDFKCATDQDVENARRLLEQRLVSQCP
ncbi:MAG: hypothetical protein KY462_14590 [Actinobacteria bacterium]|nr:hypothetical protein [Actinomycetota bacterium]